MPGRHGDISGALQPRTGHCDACAMHGAHGLSRNRCWQSHHRPSRLCTWSLTMSSVTTDPQRVRLGYALSSEEHPPLYLVAGARQAEEVGFEFALISDHYHPWTTRQGQAPFVWAVLGALATNTSKLQIGTGVTCPSVRTHPAIVAQAAATIATMMPGRFFLGVGTGGIQRTRPGRQVAGGRCTPRDARRSHRHHPRPVDG